MEQIVTVTPLEGDVVERETGVEQINAEGMSIKNKTKKNQNIPRAEIILLKYHKQITGGP